MDEEKKNEMGNDQAEKKGSDLDPHVVLRCRGQFIEVDRAERAETANQVVHHQFVRVLAGRCQFRKFRVEALPQSPIFGSNEKRNE
jgi:hypothetical protein